VSLTESEGIIFDRARSAVAALDLATAQGNRPGIILARQKLERVIASLGTHRRPNADAQALVLSALERVDRAKI
jgi:hypothetical protein